MTYGPLRRDFILQNSLIVAYGPLRQDFILQNSLIVTYGPLRRDFIMQNSLIVTYNTIFYTILYLYYLRLLTAWWRVQVWSFKAGLHAAEIADKDCHGTGDFDKYCTHWPYGTRIIRHLFSGQRQNDGPFTINWNKRKTLDGLRGVDYSHLYYTQDWPKLNWLNVKAGENPFLRHQVRLVPCYHLEMTTDPRPYSY